MGLLQIFAWGINEESGCTSEPSLSSKSKLDIGLKSSPCRQIQDDWLCGGKCGHVFMLTGSETQSAYFGGENESLLQFDLPSMDIFLLHIHLRDTLKLNTDFFCTLKICKRDWRDGSVVKSTHCTCRGPMFSSQHSQGHSQPSETLVPGNLTGSPGLCGHCMYMVQRCVFKAEHPDT